jgi:prolyl 4-hydroxylase
MSEAAPDSAGPDVIGDVGWEPVALTRAAEAGDAEATHRLAVMSGIGLGVLHDPERAMARLAQAAALGHAVAARSLALIEAEPGGLEGWFRPAAPQGVSERPHVLTVEDFVSPAVCDWLIERARPGLASAMIYDTTTGEGRVDPVRTNTAFVFDLMATDMVLVLVREKLARLAGLPVPGLEPSQVLHYRPGQKFDWHVDFLDPAVAGHRSDLDISGQRIATALIRLNDDHTGGETAFETGGLRLGGPRGSVVLWANVTPDGRPDPRTRHAGLPPTSGEKWILSQWMRPRAPKRG